MPSRSRTSATDAPLRVGLPMFRQPEDPSSPQEALTAGPAAQTPDPGTLGPQNATESLSPKPGLWTPSGETPPPASGPEDEPGSGPGWSEDEPDPQSASGSNASRGSTRTSSRAEDRADGREGLSPSEIRANKKTLKPVIGQAIEMSTTFAHEGLVRDDFERAVELYRADPDDVENISDPAAGLLARRMPAGSDNPDLADGLSLLFAIAGYIAKQMAKLTAARTLKARQLVFEPQEDQEPEQSAPGWPLQSPPPQPTPGGAA